MALNGLILDQRNNTSKNWRNILAEIMEDGIFRDGCEITFTSNSITVGGGYFIQRGAVIENDGAETIPITPTLTNGYVRLICRVDLTKEATETGPGQVEWATDFSATSTFPALVQEDILQAGSVYEIEVAVLQITSGNITAITRKLGGAAIDAEKLGGQLPSYYGTATAVAAARTIADAAMPKAGGTFTGHVFMANGARILLDGAEYEILYGALMGGGNGLIIAAKQGAGIIQLSGATNVVGTATIMGAAYMQHTMPRSTNAYDIGAPNLRYRTIYLIGAPDVSCDSAEKVLVNNVDFSGQAKKTRSAVGNIPISDLRGLIQNLEIREYKRYKNEVVNPDGENPKYERVVDEDSRELGIFVDDLKDDPLFRALGRIREDDDGNTVYSMNTMSYATLALAGAKDALNRLDKAERENAALKALLVEKGVCTQEEIESL